jgi:hypothetical protein
MQQIAIDWTAPAGTGQALKEQGQQQAADAQDEKWWADCMTALEAYLEALGPAAFPIEAFRAWAVPQVIDPPTSHKVWGSLPRKAIARGLIEAIKDANGQAVYWQATSPQTHAHPVRIYRRKAK